MNPIRVIAVIALVALAGQPRAGDPEGLASVPFGMEKGLVKKKLVTEFNMRRKFPLPRAPFMSRDGMELYVEDDRLVLLDYRLGDRSYEVILLFSAKGEFYGYTLQGEPQHAKGVSQELRSEVLALSHFYQQAYGEAGRDLQITFLGVAERAETLFSIRDDERFVVTTGVARRRASRGSGTVLVATAVVCDKRVRDGARQSETQARADD